MKREITEITTVAKTKSGFKLIFFGIIILIVSVGLLTWGIIRALVIEPSVWILTSSDRRHDKRLRKIDKIKTKQDLKDLKEKKDEKVN